MVHSIEGIYTFWKRGQFFSGCGPLVFGNAFDRGLDFRPRIRIFLDRFQKRFHKSKAFLSVQHLVRHHFLEKFVEIITHGRVRRRSIRKKERIHIAAKTQQCVSRIGSGAFIQCKEHQIVNFLLIHLVSSIAKGPIKTKTLKRS